MPSARPTRAPIDRRPNRPGLAGQGPRRGSPTSPTATRPTIEPTAAVRGAELSQLGGAAAIATATVGASTFEPDGRGCPSRWSQLDRRTRTVGTVDTIGTFALREFSDFAAWAAFARNTPGNRAQCERSPRARP